MIIHDQKRDSKYMLMLFHICQMMINNNLLTVYTASSCCFGYSWCPLHWVLYVKISWLDNR